MGTLENNFIENSHNVKHIAQEDKTAYFDAKETEAMEINDSEQINKSKIQEANAIRREGFLRFLSKMNGKQVLFLKNFYINFQVNIDLFGKMRLCGKFIAMQMSLQHYLVDQLETPTGIVEHAVLRFNFFFKYLGEFNILKNTSFFYI